MRRAARAFLSVLTTVPFIIGAPALAQSPAPAQALDVEWTLTEMAGAAMPADPAITATFASDGGLTGSGGCNSYSATWASNDGVHLTVTEPLATVRSCGDEVDARESLYLTLIPDAATSVFDGSAITLVTNAGDTLVFGGDAQVPDGLALVGDWTLATVDGQAPPTGMVVTLSIGADGTLGGGACNSYSAGYTATETGDLTVEPILATVKSCGDEQDAYESTYLTGLQAATGWGTQIGKLTIFGGAELVFGDGSTADATLTGQEWSLVSIGGAPVAGSGITAAFGEDSTVTGSGGCNRYTGPYTVDGESLSVGPLASTRMSCGPVADDLERTYLDALELATGFAISGTRLVISPSNGVALEFDTSSGPAEPTETPASASPEPPVVASPEPSVVASPGASGAPVAGGIVGSWQMTSLAGMPGGMLSIDITFSDDGTFGGFAGCNDYSGQWTLDGTSLSITGFSFASSGTCDQVTLALEQTFFGLLPFMDSAEVGADGSLTLESSLVPGQPFVFAPAG